MRAHLATDTSTATTSNGLPSTGAINVAVIAANFSDSATPIDMTGIENVFGASPGADVEDYFKEASYGKASIVPSFYGPYTINNTTSAECSSPNLGADMMNAASPYITFANFSRFIFVANCPALGGEAISSGPVSTPQGTITAAQIVLDPSSALRLYPEVHELSHTLGPWNFHAAYYVCLPDAFDSPTRFEQGCVSDEYDDPFDVLGGGPYRRVSQLDPLHKANAGWLDSTQFPTISSPGTYTYTLAPYESGGEQPLALNVLRGNSGSSFTVEYRQPIGFDAWMSSSTLCPGCTVTQGASIRLTGPIMPGYGGGSDTQLIDTTPGSIPSSYYYPFDDVQDGALTSGHTFTDPEYGISITAVSATSSGLTVQVTIPQQACAHASPTLGSVSPSSQAAGMGQTATYTVTLTNNDSAGCPANTFRYFPPGTPGLRFVASPDYFKLVPGASQNVSIAISAQASATAGSYSFSWWEGRGGGYFYSDSLGTSAAVTSGFGFQLTAPADTTPPSAPTGLTAQALGAGAVKLSWQPATDNVGVVGYTVTSSAGRQYTTTGTTFVDPNASASSAYTYSVTAHDRQGNNSSAATAAVTTPAKTDFTRPTPPDVTVAATDHSISVSWSASTDDVGVAYYRVTPCLVANCVLPANTRSFTADGLPTQTRYDLQVRAYDGDGNPSDSCCGTFTLYTGAAGDSPPTQPQRLVSTAGTYHSVTLTWAASAGADHYDVYRNSRKICSTTSTSYTDLDAGGSAQYYVQAADAAGSLSAPSLKEWFLPPTSSSADSNPPTSTITAPADGATVSGTVNISATASDDVGVSRVELYVDGVLKATSTTAPYTFSWDSTAVGDGPHWLYVLAYDTAGNYGTAGGTMVTVANAGSADTTPPAILIASPSNDATVSGTVPVSASASDDVGVTSVKFYVDGLLQATSTTAPYGFTWDASNATVGSHTITATAYDAAGNSSSSSVTVSVLVPDTTPPTVSFAAPANGATLSGTTSVQLNASDDVSVSRVVLSVDGSVLATDTASPWTFSLNTSTLTAGTHTLTATAYDPAGNRASAQISVNVLHDTSPPSTPSGLKLAVAGTTQVAIYWTRSTDDTSVAGYDVYRDGVEIAFTRQPNYLSSGLAAGTSHYYSVRAVDAVGYTSSASSNLNVKTVASSTASTGTITGVVYAASGAPLANAMVQLSGNGISASTKTNASGVYKFGSLKPAQYSLTITPPATPTTSSTPQYDPAVSVTAGQTVVVATDT